MMSRHAELRRLHAVAREIFSEALKSVDAMDAMRRQVHLSGSRLTVVNRDYNLESIGDRVYAVAIGKAALRMSAALDEILGDSLTAGVVAAARHSTNPPQLSSRWKVFEGGHPLPNEESLEAARAAIALLRRANDARALVLFLISGGGSATFEWPRDEKITLEDLREANRVLVSCGATIAEINSVRSAFSAVKGGRLSALAPHAEQVSLIISDTNRGEESMVASGPTFTGPEDAPGPREALRRYHLERSLPPSILQAVGESAVESRKISNEAYGKHYLLLDNQSAIEAAARTARAHGFVVEIARDIIEQPVQKGCVELLSRLYAGNEARGVGEVFCLISGGEFSCSVRGDGKGGRNAETALRCALELEMRRQTPQGAYESHTVILSAGTDGIDGNSPAAGAVADETTTERARAMGLDARSFLERSDSYTFFNALGDEIMTGPTGTNVRDLRIMIRQQ